MLTGRILPVALPVALVASGWTGSAVAQDVPLIDGVGAWSHSQTMRHRDGEERNAKPVHDGNRTDGQRRLMALSPEARRSLIALKPELDRRTREHGAVSANRWFESKVAQAERREGLRK